MPLSFSGAIRSSHPPRECGITDQITRYITIPVGQNTADLLAT